MFVSNKIQNLINGHAIFGFQHLCIFWQLWRWNKRKWETICHFGPVGWSNTCFGGFEFRRVHARSLYIVIFLKKNCNRTTNDQQVFAQIPRKFYGFHLIIIAACCCVFFVRLLNMNFETNFLAPKQQIITFNIWCRY
jgi:hypothetical protein